MIKTGCANCHIWPICLAKRMKWIDHCKEKLAIFKAMAICLLLKENCCIGYNTWERNILIAFLLIKRFMGKNSIQLQHIYRKNLRVSWCFERLIWTLFFNSSVEVLDTLNMFWINPASTGGKPSSWNFVKYELLIDLTSHSELKSGLEIKKFLEGESPFQHL